MVASQGGPREHLARFRAIGTKWLHVVASVEHALKAEAAGVDALVVDGAEAGGHPPPSEVGTLVLVRRVVKRWLRWWRQRRGRRRRRRAARARRRGGAATRAS
jgi:NAD(P)H-dependent flavin oxidoreductase YrpB (nitropropane dioxygenase family)